MIPEILDSEVTKAYSIITSKGSVNTTILRQCMEQIRTSLVNREALQWTSIAAGTVIDPGTLFRMVYRGTGNFFQGTMDKKVYTTPDYDWYVDSKTISHDTADITTQIAQLLVEPDEWNDAGIRQKTITRTKTALATYDQLLLESQQTTMPNVDIPTTTTTTTVPPTTINTTYMPTTA